MLERAEGVARAELRPVFPPFQVLRSALPGAPEETRVTRENQVLRTAARQAAQRGNGGSARVRRRPFRTRRRAGSGSLPPYRGRRSGQAGPPPGGGVDAAVPTADGDEAETHRRPGPFRSLDARHAPVRTPRPAQAPPPCPREPASRAPARTARRAPAGTGHVGAGCVGAGQPPRYSCQWRPETRSAMRATGSVCALRPACSRRSAAR